jgi:Icc-related predicted phosphoesterase
MLIVGDVHGEFDLYKYLVKGAKESIQLGDLYLGFPNKKELELPSQHKFIRGNHDDPDLIRKHPNYLGEYGMYKGIFFVSGAYSVNWYHFKEDTTFHEEEISNQDCAGAIELYNKERPSVVITHMAPHSVELDGFKHLKRGPRKCRTSEAFDVMLKIQPPDLWIFGHYHMHIDYQAG